MTTLEELHAHYTAVRARLNAGPPKKVEPPKVHLVVVKNEPYIPPAPEPEPEPEPVAAPLQVILSPAQKILNEVSIKHGMSISDIKGDKRKKKYILARHEACYRMYMELGFSLPQIGRVVGKRDHTTILNAVRKHKKRNGLD